MTNQQSLNELVASHGEKMIEVRIRLWTNDIADEKDHVVPKHAWTSGVVMMETNESHGITSKNPKPFHSLLDLSSIIEKVLLENNIKLHPSRRMTKYVDCKKTQ